MGQEVKVFFDGKPMGLEDIELHLRRLEQAFQECQGNFDRLSDVERKKVETTGLFVFMAHANSAVQLGLGACALARGVGAGTAGAVKDFAEYVVPFVRDLESRLRAAEADIGELAVEWGGEHRTLVLGMGRRPFDVLQDFIRNISDEV